MSRPDPNGCPDCGHIDCKVPALLAAMKGRADVSVDEYVRLGSARSQCITRPRVDWQAECRALAAEPPPEVMAAAERLLELAGMATEGPWGEVVWYGTDEGGWAAAGPHHTGGDDECDDDASDNHGRAERDAAFIAACRTLAPFLAEWVRGRR